MVSTVMLYGRVLEIIDVSKERFESVLRRMVGGTRVDPDDIGDDL